MTTFNWETLQKVQKALEKRGFVPGGQIPSMPQGGMMPPMMGGGMPMDPSMMGGGMPMDPSMMGGGMSMDPSMMGGGMPMDPSMMGGGMPMDPSMMGGAPPAEAAPPSEEASGGGMVERLTSIEKRLDEMSNTLRALAGRGAKRDEGGY